MTAVTEILRAGKRRGLYGMGPNSIRAFEAYLRTMRVEYLCLEETQQTFASTTARGIPEFLVQSSTGALLLIHLRGVRLASMKFLFENWTTQERIANLQAWEETFGGDSKSLIVFAYELALESWKSAFVSHFTYADRHFGFLAVYARDYQQAMEVYSVKAQTVYLPKVRFQEMAIPVSKLL